jgi:hypothetical protein
MMRFNCFLCLLMLLAVCCPFPADAETTGAKWVFVGFTKYRDALFIDMNRLTREADRQTQVWSRITPAERSKYYPQRNELPEPADPLSGSHILQPGRSGDPCHPR